MKKQKRKLHKLWLRQLQKEFQNICFISNVKLRTPIFEISTARARYGSWNPASGTLRISEYLIETYSWDTTINVLKHEMAHQLCTEYYGEGDTPHGPEFQRGCEQLRVPESFRSATGDLAEEIKASNQGDVHNDAGRRVIAKVKKLLALAGSSNEHEAALAMQKAGELMDAHNLQQLELDQREGYIYQIIELKKKQIARYQKSICTILRDFFHVEVIMSKLYDPHADATFRTIDLFGREENVAIADHCYHFLENRLETLWNEHRALYKGNLRVAKASYYLGMLQGFREKLQIQQIHYQKTKETRVSSPKDLTALMKVEDQHLHSFVRQRFPFLTRRKSPGMKINKQTYEKGVETGKNIVLHGAVHEKSVNSGGLLD
ncbi:MAG: SprT-like domain-containing protein [Desulfobulbaceae bacterium]|nr:SprT-like domain-containing protein [Desulfobulbaceae bacterium]